MPALGASSRLVLLDRRPAGDGATMTLRLSDGVVSISKGSGVDADAVAATLHVAAGGTHGALMAPAGAFSGTAGWASVTASRARYRDTSAAAAVRRTIVREGEIIRLSGGNPGDALLDALASRAPGGAIFVDYRVANGSETLDHCVVYRFCARRVLRSGGSRLDCLDPEADPLCRAVPAVCGSGVREAGEACDGGAYCTSGCAFPSLSPGCCQAETSCRSADGFSLNYSLMQYCGGFGGETPVQGGVCSAGGTCEQLAIDPVPLCCRLAGSCYDATVNSTSGLWSFRNNCTGAQGGDVVPAAVCGPTSACEPG
jgi:hypothetical protein